MDIMKELNGVFRRLFEDESLVVTRSTTAQDIDDWDSITHMILVTAVEKKFGVKFSLAELTTLNMVGDMADLVEKKLSEKR
jgi:acyl carrier protein